MSTKLTAAELKELELAGFKAVSDSKSIAAEKPASETVAEDKVYAGDSERELPRGESKWETLAIDDPAAVVEMFDDAVNEGKVTLHPWQVEVSEQLAAAKPTSLLPHKFCLCACNGSGKDAYVIAPFVIWFALTKARSLTIITSSSGSQLTAQTEGYIRRLAEKINAKMGEEWFKINQRFIKCLKSGSEIRLFATDEAGKAEGYHPLEPDAEMSIIVNEAKSVSPAIFGALSRCTGFNYWLNVSTPGEPYGDFHSAFEHFKHKRHVSTFDCPHLSPDEREYDKKHLGEHSAIYRSKHLALFTSLGGQVIIPIELVDDVVRKTLAGVIPKMFQHWPLRIGGDLAAGGDESVLTGVKGNSITERICFIQRDTTVTADVIEHHLINTFKVPKEHDHLYFDDGGVGRGIIDNLRRRGWNIRRILNQSPATNRKEFGNRGAEAWYRAKRIIEEYLFRLDDDKEFKDQLSNRYYKQQQTQGRITLQSKADAKAHGRPSPDRADSFLLALTGLTIDDFLGADKVTSDNKGHDEEAGTIDGKRYRPQRGRIIRGEEDYDEETFANFNAEKVKQVGKAKPSHGSLSSILSRN